MAYAYPCEIDADDDGNLVATFPDVPEAITGGQGRAETLRLAADALATALAGYAHDERDVPEPSIAADGQELVVVPAAIAAKLALYTAMRSQHITNTELARLLGMSVSATRKLTDPDHRSRIEQIQNALDAVGCHLVIDTNVA